MALAIAKTERCIGAADNRGENAYCAAGTIAF